MGNLSRLILKNSSLNAGRTVIVSLLTFITTPIILRSLGAEQYGIWALVIAFASYANFLELGFNSAVTRLVASSQNQKSIHSTNSVLMLSKVEASKCKNQNDILKIKNNSSNGYSIASQINSTVITYMIVSALVFVLAAIFLQPVKFLLFHNISVSHLDLMLLGTLACFLMNLITSNYLSVLSGRMRMDLTNLIAVATNAVQNLGSIALLFLGYGLFGVFLASVASSILGSILSVVLAKREYSSLFFDLRRYDFASIRDLFKFSLKIYFINTSGNFIVSTNKFLISAIAGLQFVAYYEIGWKIVNQVRVFFQNILEPIYPASSIIVSSEAEHDGERRKKAFNKAFKYLLLLSGVAYCAMFLLSYPFIFFWLGEKYVQISLIVIIIGIGNWFNLQTAVGFYFLMALNRLHSAVKSAIFSLAGNFALGLLSWYFFGFYGMLAGFSLGLSLASIWFIFQARREV